VIGGGILDLRVCGTGAAVPGTAATSGIEGRTSTANMHNAMYRPIQASILQSRNTKILCFRYSGAETIFLSDREETRREEYVRGGYYTIPS